MVLLAYVTAVMSGIGVTLYSTLLQQQEINQQLLNDSRLVSVAKAAEATRGFFNEFKRYPDDLDELEGTPGFEYVATYRHRDLRYVLEEDINDGSFVFNRVGIYAQNIHREDELTDLEAVSAANNNCGVGAFDTAQSFCFDPRMAWWRAEDRTSVAPRLRDIRQSMTYTIADFVTGLNAGGFVPRERSDGTEMDPDDIETLASIVGYAGTSAACTGQYRFEQVLLDCEDLFSVENSNAISYRYIDINRFMLVVDSGMSDLTGAPIIIGREFEVPNF